jgi:hypothetical protein
MISTAWVTERTRWRAVFAGRSVGGGSAGGAWVGVVVGGGGSEGVGLVVDVGFKEIRPAEDFHRDLKSDPCRDN